MTESGPRDQDPVADDELEAVSDAIRDQRDEIREYLEGEGVDVDWDDRDRDRDE